MYKRILLTAFFAVAAFSAIQAQSLVKFDQTTQDFGEVKESENPRLTHTFSFTNISEGAVKIIDVKAGGYRLTPTWTPGAIQPGRNGSVIISFDLRGQSGPFNHAAVVKAAPFNKDDNTVDSASATASVVYLKGSVVARERTPAELYHHESGSLRMSSKYVNFGQITDKEVGEEKLTIYNQGEKPVKIESAETEPYVEVVFPEDGQREIKPKQTLDLQIKFDGSKAGDYYWKHSSITLVTNDDTLARKRISASATILPDFTEMSEEDSLNGPRIAFDKTEHDFGDIMEGDVVETTFKFTNTGKSTLKILKTKASCGCTATQPEKKELAPGESSSISVKFNSAHKNGPQHKSIHVVTNDPTNPMSRLGIKSNVSKKAGE